ncbi:MAG: RMD1 family protein [Methylobacteriaceae bacterium]|nr:RMD1 family protein [Methylobacteriaceae bacterium]
MSAAGSTSGPPPGRLVARALLLGDRIDTVGLERSDALFTTPLAFRSGSGFVALFRYGAAVLVGLTPIEEDEVLRGLRHRIVKPFVKPEEEIAAIELAPEREEQIPPGGPITLRALPPERLLVIADALAKSVALARDEHEVASVFDTIEPFARRLADRGRAPGARRSILRVIGNALLVQHRVSGRVAVEEKPDVLWDRPDLERLYARLEDEYELKERAGALSAKLAVIGDTATAMTDLIHTERSLRLEAIIVLLIVVEVLVTFYQLATGKG